MSEHWRRVWGWLLVLALSGAAPAALRAQDAAHAPDGSKPAAADSGQPGRPAIQASDLAGAWSGAIALPGMSLRIGVQFTLDNAGGLKGSVSIPQQGAKGLPLEPITLNASSVRFVLKGIPGDPTFDGSLDTSRPPQEQEIAGKFTQGDIQTTFSLKRGELAPRLRKQDPRPPFPYEIEEVKVPASAPDNAFTLAGTLTVPKGPGPFPAAVLITGSGAQNRDEELMDHRPFRVLADHLTRAGIAVLRCDDRGFAESGGEFTGATTADFADDALACVAFLKKDPRIGPVGLIGHSEGGLAAPMAAVKAGEHGGVAFIVLLAGPGVPGVELMERQNELIALSSGATPEGARSLASHAAELFRAVVADKGEDELRTLATELVKAQHGVMGGGVEAPADLSDNEKKAVEVQIATLRSPWFKRFLSTDPRDFLEKVTVPVLAVNGSLDVQVSADENIRGIEQAIRRAGNKDVTTRVFPGLNHLFQRCVDLETFDPKDPARWSKGAVSWYATNPETMNDDVMKFVQEWIVQRFPTPAPGAPDPSGQGGR